MVSDQQNLGSGAYNFLDARILYSKHNGTFAEWVQRPTAIPPTNPR